MNHELVRHRPPTEFSLNSFVFILDIVKNCITLARNNETNIKIYLYLIQEIIQKSYPHYGGAKQTKQSKKGSS
jgi:hypothetical protein